MIFIAGNGMNTAKNNLIILKIKLPEAEKI